ncbi:transcription termination/antitermination NusG family protein [Lentibacillus sp. N15]|uniref:transcription termination/antitermination NusG family protein n=1 Tax=Lentibacillus songyuanensis TaxID=3136161 RepID=UPI0031BAF18B
MVAVFAIQVRTGLEIKAKEMLKHVFGQANEFLVKGIYALETYTEFINSQTNTIDTKAEINEGDISSHLIKDRYRSAITNLRLQLEAIERYNSPEYENKKSVYRQQIRQLENEMTTIKKTSKSLHNVMSGYILVELEHNSTYLPKNIWHLIKNVPFVNKILSTTPIPEEEMRCFINNLEEITLPEAEINFGKQTDEETIDEVQAKSLTELNQKETTKEWQNKLLDRIDDINVSVVEKIKTLLENKPVLHKVKAFVKRSAEIVSMPLHYLEKLYTNEELQCIGQRLNKKNFLHRLDHFTNEETLE